MASLFDKDPGAKAELPTYGMERIESEIAHLRNPQSTRTKQEQRYARAWLVVGFAVLVLLTLYLLDPILHSYEKGRAIKTYLYLHSYGDDVRAKALVSTRILSEYDVLALNHAQPASQDSFPSPQAAEASADAIIAYCNQVRYLQAGQYDRLGALDKLRYNLFLRWSIPVPMEWTPLDPLVK